MEKKTENTSNKGVKRKRLIVVILVVAMVLTFLRLLLFSTYSLPTSAMEKTLLVGDVIFVHKIPYWQLKFSGTCSVKHNDILVFKWPAEDEQSNTEYIKRCVGVAGDTLFIRDQQVYINGKAEESLGKYQYAYIVETQESVSKNTFSRLDIIDVGPATEGYLIHTSEEKAQKLRELSYIQSVTKIEMKEGESDEDAIIYPHSSKYAWNADQFGPLWIPKKNATIQLTEENIIKYESVIRRYEGHDNVEVANGQLVIDGVVTSNYTFKQNYYFTMGDSRHNSLDSRYWGFVPEDHIRGKAWLVLFSIQDFYNGSFFNKKIRTNRFFKVIR